MRDFILVIFQNAMFSTPLFFVLGNFKKRAMAHSLVRFLKFPRAEKAKLKNSILKEHGYIIDEFIRKVAREYPCYWLMKKFLL